MHLFYEGENFPRDIITLKAYYDDLFLKLDYFLGFLLI